MTQRIFDIENEKDMQDLWEILPDWADKITKRKKENEYDIIRNIAFDAGHRCLFNINWHDKTEITRPMNYESMIGCVGFFWDNTECCKDLGVLTGYEKKRDGDPFYRDNAVHYCKFRPAKKSELKFWENEE